MSIGDQRIWSEACGTYLRKSGSSVVICAQMIDGSALSSTTETMKTSIPLISAGGGVGLGFNLLRRNMISFIKAMHELFNRPKRSWF